MRRKKIKQAKIKQRKQLRHPEKEAAYKRAVENELIQSKSESPQKKKAAPTEFPFKLISFISFVSVEIERRVALPCLNSPRRL